ncbi:nucleoside/nucleotide kinase family protein [Jannaschia sp. R86511]|uniref:nucleoside/nucleotide kinase family protein n=1 Tax=Jannaschia sp. R86511 TaxID=3093853 RepID=UPI0036D3D18D
MHADGNHQETSKGPGPLPDELDDLARRALSLVPAGGRALVGITGSPGAGKTTLAAALASRADQLARADEPARADQPAREGEPAGSDGPGAAPDDPLAVHVPMDGFHLANATLDRLGLRQRKGAVETFDGWGFVALLRRLLVETEHTVYAPGFDRAVDEGVTGAVAVPASARLVVVEGNYLLVDAQPWAQVRDVLAETWFCETPEAVRMDRLVTRHQAGGRTPDAALAWAETVDGGNAALIETTRARADLIISGTAPHMTRSTP